LLVTGPDLGHDILANRAKGFQQGVIKLQDFDEAATQAGAVTLDMPFTGRRLGSGCRKARGDEARRQSMGT
jgi:hypothetical protein